MPRGNSTSICSACWPAYRVPRAKLALMAGLALQFTGALLLAVDLYRALAASNLLVNCGVIGGLLLVAAI